MQALCKCWTGRCSTCQQPIDLDDIPFSPPLRKDE
jgi:hypothetical protein